MTRRIREAVYELGDEDLIRELESIVLALSRLAGSMERQEFGKQCLPRIDAVLKRLAEFEASSAFSSVQRVTRR